MFARILNMDRLDRISIWAIVILIISSSALISHHMGEARTERKDSQRMSASVSQVVNPEVANNSKIIKNLMESSNLIKAESLAKEMIEKYPYEGELRMLMGDIFVRKQEIVKAVEEYKSAVDLNPDYLDKKITALYQGKKLKRVVSEALLEIEEKSKINPQDESLGKFRKDIYYLQRRIAGSCG
jgi:lipopolysaccharide biosynthesis regulator YciM